MIVRACALAALLLIILSAASPVRAACSAAGDILYNDDDAIMQYCDGTDWIPFPKNPSATPPAPTDPCAPANTPAIGQVCDDGTVYAGNTPDGGGPMFTTRCDWGQEWDGAACVNDRKLLTWDNGSGASFNAGAGWQDDGDGNTAILAGNSGTGAPYIAARACASLSLNHHSDWYLPARNEVEDVMYPNRAAIGNFSDASPWRDLWTSTEGSVTSAIKVRMSTGLTNGEPKNNLNSVRCVRQGYVGHCYNPAGFAGDILYNRDHNVLQWCDGEVWQAAGEAGGDPLASPPPLSNGLKAYWPFDEGAGTAVADVTGNGYDGTLVGNAAFNAVGMFNSTAEFQKYPDTNHMSTGKKF